MQQEILISTPIKSRKLQKVIEMTLKSWEKKIDFIGNETFPLFRFVSLLSIVLTPQKMGSFWREFLLRSLKTNYTELWQIASNQFTKIYPNDSILFSRLFSYYQTNSIFKIEESISLINLIENVESKPYWYYQLSKIAIKSCRLDLSQELVKQYQIMSPNSQKGYINMVKLLTQCGSGESSPDLLIEASIQGLSIIGDNINFFIVHIMNVFKKYPDVFLKHISVLERVKSEYWLPYLHIILCKISEVPRLDYLLNRISTSHLSHVLIHLIYIDSVENRRTSKYHDILEHYRLTNTKLFSEILTLKSNLSDLRSDIQDRLLIFSFFFFFILPIFFFFFF